LQGQEGGILLNRMVEIILRLLEDEILEVRNSAKAALTCLISYRVVNKRRDELIGQFKAKCLNQTPTVKHGAILGLCAFVSAHPNRLPKYLPTIVVLLCQFLHDPQPIQVGVDKVVCLIRGSQHFFLFSEFCKPHLEGLHEEPQRELGGAQAQIH